MVKTDPRHGAKVTIIKAGLKHAKWILINSMSGKDLTFNISDIDALKGT